MAALKWNMNKTLLWNRSFFKQTSSLLFFLSRSWWKPAMGWFHLSDYWEGQGLWEVCRRKDNKSLTVVLYFFLLQDAPSSPSVLIGSGEHPCARCADVNRASRTSAAGTNIPTSLLPFLHTFSLLHINLIWVWNIYRTSVVLTFLLIVFRPDIFWCCLVIVSWISNWLQFWYAQRKHGLHLHTTLMPKKDNFKSLTVQPI